MLKKLTEAVKQMVTESDNLTHDLFKWIALGGFFTFNANQGYAIYKGMAFDPQGYGIGMGALLGGIGIALGLKKEKRPCPEKETAP